MKMKDVEEFAENTLIVLTCMAVGWAVCVGGLWLLGVL